MSAVARRGAAARSCAGLALALLAACAGGEPPHFVVRSNLDTADASGDGICDDGNGNCTLRAAIEESSASGGTIEFALPDGQAVDLTSDLVLSHSVEVGNCSGTAVTIRGGDNALRITGDRVELRGVHLVDFRRPDGALVLSGDRNRVECIRVERAGIAIELSGSGNRILDSTFADNRDGVLVQSLGGEPPPAKNEIADCSFLGGTGNAAITDTGTHTIIARNVVRQQSRVGSSAIDLVGRAGVVSDNLTDANHMGIKVRGQAYTVSNNDVIDSRGDGIFVEPEARATVVGANTVVANEDGIYVHGAEGVEIRDNLAFDNLHMGIDVGVASQDCLLQGNVLEANHLYGIGVFAARAIVIEGNRVAYNTGYGGIWLRDTEATLRANAVRNNSGAGIRIEGGHAFLTSNSLYENSAGVDCEPTRFSLDGLRVERRRGGTGVRGSLHGKPGARASLEFFWSPDGDQGLEPIGVETKRLGRRPTRRFAVPNLARIPAGGVVTALVSGENGTCGGFSAPVAAD